MANQGFLLAAEHTGGTTLLLIASINFLNSSSSAIAKRTGSLSRSGLEVYREADWKSIAKRTGSLSRSGLEVYREADWKS
ncbi:MAG: hypothetical protein O4859_12655, partial [Trichodesmium sp. St18_bin1]|nr:hypothetical protein [Trichodesmium sp. St18_bin1]